MTDEEVEEADSAPDRFGWRRRIRAHPTAYAVYRAGVGVLGLLIVVTGVILLPLPGPGWLIIFLGIGVWATEFDWAHSLLRFAKDKVGAWTKWLGRQNRFVQGLVSLSICLLVVVCFWLIFLVSGVPAFFPQWAKDLLDYVPGL